MKRNSMNIIFCLFLMGASSFLVDGSERTGVAADKGPRSSEFSMGPAHKAEAGDIPPIDAVLPGSFETASFGLG